jgi:protein associated with RNAse G/E
MRNDSTARGPREGDFITIKSYKHDGSLHRTWRDTMVLKTSENAIIGLNDHTIVTEGDGRRWVTREPAILYFHKKYWFNIVAMIRENGVSYYCNLASPYTLDREALKYIDYDLDVKVHPDGERHLLDADEYAVHSRKWHYPPEIDKILKAHVKILVDWINNETGPFSQGYIDVWYARYQHLMQQRQQDR